MVDFDHEDAAAAAKYAIAFGGRQLFEQEQNMKEHPLATASAINNSTEYVEVAAHADITIRQSQASDLWLSSVGNQLKRDVVLAFATMHWSYACSEYHFDLRTMVGVY